MGLFWLAVTGAPAAQLVSALLGLLGLPARQLVLAQPPASWLSVNFPSPRFVRRTFFRRCGCLLGPVSAGIGIDVGAGDGTRERQSVVHDKTPQDMGPSCDPLGFHSRPQQKKYTAARL